MFTKDDLLNAMVGECHITKHLAERLPEESLDYRPTENQRSTLELMRYLSFCGIAAARTMVEGSWDSYEALETAAQTLEAGDFAAAMDRQIEELTSLFAALSPEDFQEKKCKLPNGQEVKLSEGLLNTTMRWLTAYRMQLFLYAKQSGNTDLGTLNNWYGVDPQKKS